MIHRDTNTPAGEGNAVKTQSGQYDTKCGPLAITIGAGHLLQGDEAKNWSPGMNRDAGAYQKWWESQGVGRSFEDFRKAPRGGIRLLLTPNKEKGECPCKCEQTAWIQGTHYADKEMELDNLKQNSPFYTDAANEVLNNSKQFKEPFTTPGYELRDSPDAAVRGVDKLFVSCLVCRKGTSTKDYALVARVDWAVGTVDHQTGKDAIATTRVTAVYHDGSDPGGECEKVVGLAEDWIKAQGAAPKK